MCVNFGDFFVLRTFYFFGLIDHMMGVESLCDWSVRWDWRERKVAKSNRNGYSWLRAPIYYLQKLLEKKFLVIFVWISDLNVLKIDRDSQMKIIRIEFRPFLCQKVQNGVNWCSNTLFSNFYSIIRWNGCCCPFFGTCLIRISSFSPFMSS